MKTMRAGSGGDNRYAAKPETALQLFTVLPRILSLAATPTFALMALLSGVFDGRYGMHDLEVHDAGSHGMVLMYLLMSVFHASPWLKLLAIRRRRKQQA